MMGEPQALIDPGKAKAEAEANLTALRAAWQRFTNVRLATNAAINQAATAAADGNVPGEVSAKVMELRDKALNEQAAVDLGDLLGLLYQRKPTQGELELGPPDGAGLAAFGVTEPLALAAIAGGAWKLTSTYDALANTEVRIQKALGIGGGGWKRWAAGAAGVLVGGLAVYGLVSLNRSRKLAAQSEPEEEEEVDVLEVEDEAEPEEES